MLTCDRAACVARLAWALPLGAKASVKFSWYRGSRCELHAPTRCRLHAALANCAVCIAVLLLQGTGTNKSRQAPALANIKSFCMGRVFAPPVTCGPAPLSEQKKCSAAVIRQSALASEDAVCGITGNTSLPVCVCSTPHAFGVLPQHAIDR